jgi:hypothetical protein
VDFVLGPQEVPGDRQEAEQRETAARRKKAPKVRAIAMVHGITLPLSI